MDILKLLLSKGADVESMTEQGFTPLILAIRQGQHECIELLLQRRANVEICDAQRRTALGHAAAAQDLHAMQLVLRAASKEQRRAHGHIQPITISSRNHAPIIALPPGPII